MALLEHWIAVGFVSEAARNDIEAADGAVLDVSSVPPVVLVCLRYDDEYIAPVAQRGEDLQLWSYGEIQVRSKGLHLKWQGPYVSIVEARITALDEPEEADEDEEPAPLDGELPF